MSLHLVGNEHAIDELPGLDPRWLRPHTMDRMTKPARLHANDDRKQNRITIHERDQPLFWPPKALMMTSRTER